MPFITEINQDKFHAWVEAFVKETGFQPIISWEELQKGKISFRQYRKDNYQWLRDHIEEAIGSAEEAVDFDEEE